METTVIPEALCERNCTLNTTNMTLANSEEYKLFYQKAQNVTGLFFCPIVCIFGLTGNLISIVVLSQKKMATSTNTFLTALAVSDGIKLITDLFYFLVILLLNVNRAAGERSYVYLYPYAHYFFNMSVCTTAWLTVSVAAERYILVCHATKARDLCSIRRARMTSAAVFLVTIILALPLGLRYETVHYFDQARNVTSVKLEVTELWQDQTFVTTYTWIQNLLRSVVPLLILCTLNYFIVQAFRRTRAAKKKMSSRHRVTLMLVCVIIVFMVCVTPDAIMSTFFGFGYYEASFLVRGVREITDLLLTVNSAVNVVLYCTFNKVFRKSFMALCCRRCYNGHGISQDEVWMGRRSSLATIRHTTMNGSKKDHNSASEERIILNIQSSV